MGLCALACRPAEPPGASSKPTAAPQAAVSPGQGPNSSDSGLRADPESAAVEPPPPPRHPILDAEIRQARRWAQGRLLREGDAPQPDPAPLPEGPLPGPAQPVDPPERLPGFFVPLELPEDGAPLEGFEAALAALAAGEAQGPVRVAAYGASGTAVDLWTGYVRSYLQARFGDGGPGIVAAAKPNRWYRHNELAVRSSKHWRRHNSYRLDDDEPPGKFGVMGQAVSAASRWAWTEIRPQRDAPSATELAVYEVHYLARPEGGSFRVKIDGELVDTVATARDPDAPAELGVRRFELEPGAAHELRIELEGDGRVQLLGVVAETERPGVVLDTLGVNGARTSNQSRWDQQLWAEHLQLRDPALYLLAFGNNECVDEGEPMQPYIDEYRASLERFRATLPEAGCVMLGPGGFPRIAEDGSLEPRPRLDAIRSVQRELAEDYGCAFLDTHAIYGGDGAKQAWVDAGLGKDDYLHLTREGYLRFGLSVGDALVQRFDWRELVADDRSLALR